MVFDALREGQGVLLAGAVVISEDAHVLLEHDAISGAILLHGAQLAREDEPERRKDAQERHHGGDVEPDLAPEEDGGTRGNSHKDTSLQGEKAIGPDRCRACLWERPTTLPPG